MVAAGNAVGKLEQGKTGRAPGAGELVRLALVGALSLSGVAMAQVTETEAMSDGGEQQRSVQAREIPRQPAPRPSATGQIPDPHWRADGCPACHAGTPARGAVRLRDADIDRLCNSCHDSVSPHSYIHPTGMPLPAAMARRLPKSFQESIKRGGGKMTCIACHDLPAQCLPARARERGLNPRFFREGPYRDRTALCYRCHDPLAYERLNPHDQIDARGQRREARCRVCHEPAPPAADASAKADFNVRGDLTALCTGCHPWVPHPGGAFSFTREEGPNHLVVPSAGVARRMTQQARAQDIVLPLDPNTGRVYCGTCHNTHARGVLQGAAARGAESKDRLRSPQLCGACHEK